MENKSDVLIKESGEDYYKDIVDSYTKNKYSKGRRSLEWPTYNKMLGELNLTNEDIIDLACGSGFWTQNIRNRTKGKVYGVDISEPMIAKAKSFLSDHEDITYIVADCSMVPLPIDHKFDIVSATFLLQYANSEDMLERFVKNIYNLLKPGGKLIGLNFNMYFT